MVIHVEVNLGGLLRRQPEFFERLAGIHDRNAFKRLHQSEAETKVLVSATILTRGPFGADGIYLGLDFSHGHGCARERPELAHHLEEIARIFFRGNLARDQARQLLRFEQPFRPCLGGDRFRQIQLDSDAHNADKMPATSAACQLGAEHATQKWRAKRGLLIIR